MRRSELLHHGQRRTRTGRLGIPDRQRPYGTGRRHRMRRQHDPAKGSCRRTGDRPAGRSGTHPRRHRRHLPRTGRDTYGSDGRQTGLRGIRHAAERQKTGVRRANGRLRPQIPRTSPRRHRPTRSMRITTSWFRRASKPIWTTFSGHTSSPSTNSTATTSPQPRPVWNASHPPCRRIRR